MTNGTSRAARRAQAAARARRAVQEARDGLGRCQRQAAERRASSLLKIEAAQARVERHRARTAEQDRTPARCVGADGEP